MNFYSDNESLSFYLHHPEMGPVIAVREKNFAQAGEHPEVPANAEEAMSQYEMALNLLGSIAIGTALSLGFSPIPVAVGVALSSSLGFMMPVSTPPNAIVYASGLVPITKMFKSGIIVDIVGVLLITIPLVLWLVKAVMGV